MLLLLELEVSRVVVCRWVGLRQESLLVVVSVVVGLGLVEVIVLLDWEDDVLGLDLEVLLVVVSFVVGLFLVEDNVALALLVFVLVLGLEVSLVIVSVVVGMG